MSNSLQKSKHIKSLQTFYQLRIATVMKNGNQICLTRLIFYKTIFIIMQQICNSLLTESCNRLFPLHSLRESNKTTCLNFI